MTDSPNKPMIQPTLHTAATVIDIQVDNCRTKTFVLQAAADASPGQYVMVWQPGFDEKPFSLVASDPLTLMITSVGPTTRLFHELQIGDKLWLRGPFGQGFTVSDTVKHVLLVGGGYGVAPLLNLANNLLEQVEHISVVVGAQTADLLLYVDRFKRLQELSAEVLDIHLATDDGSVGAMGFVTVPARQILEQRNIDCLYACGPDVMLDSLRNLSGGFGTPCQLSWEAYMRCGMGLCGSCEHEGRLLCMDGPVLRYDA